MFCIQKWNSQLAVSGIISTIFGLLSLVYLSSAIDESINPVANEAAKPTLKHNEHVRARLKAMDPNALRALDHLNCERVFANDQQYIAKFVEDHGRIQFNDPIFRRNLPMSCTAIHRRNYFPKIGHQGNDGSNQFPLAYARVVYRDYVFLEMELAAAYSPRNWYCYCVDSGASAQFKRRMRQLSRCLPNVLLVEGLSVKRGGQNMNKAHLRCLEQLDSDDLKWEYVALIQNHDVTIRTNREAVQVYQWLEGANDIEVLSVPPHKIDESRDWSFAALHLFRKRHLNHKGPAPWLGYPPRLALAKGSTAMSLTRAMARFIVRDLDLSVFFKQLDPSVNGIDEFLFNTLQATDAIQAPGGFTHTCLDRGAAAGQITRMALWFDKARCGTHHMRHDVCVFGMEDLATKFAGSANLFANKLMPEFDFGAAVCWYEKMFERSRLEDPNSIQRVERVRHVYANIPHVRFQKYRRLLADLIEQFDDPARRKRHRFVEHLDKFNCGAGYGEEILKDLAVKWRHDWESSENLAGTSVAQNGSQNATFAERGDINVIKFVVP